MLSVRTFPVADGDFLYVSVLTEKLGLPQCLQQLIFPDSRCQPSDVNQVFLHDPYANEILPVLLFGFAFLDFLMSLLLCSLFLVLLNIGTKFGNPASNCVSLTNSLYSPRTVIDVGSDVGDCE